MRFCAKLFGNFCRNSSFANYLNEVSLCSKFIARKYSCPKSVKCTEGKSRALRDKVAIVTGGANGIGLQFVREFLKRGAVGVTIADINTCNGERAAEILNKEFGKGRVMFVKCDVTKSELFDWAYKQTLKYYGHIDVVVNNAGIMNDVKWEHSIATNIGGCLVGSLLGIQYMSKSAIGSGGIIINVACISSIIPFCGIPIYSTTQSAILTFSRALGSSRQYKRTGVKIVTVCIGPTNTSMYKRAPQNTINENFQEELEDEMEDCKVQKPVFIARTLMNVMIKAKSGSVWIIANGNAPYRIELPSEIENLIIGKKEE